MSASLYQCALIIGHNKNIILYISIYVICSYVIANGRKHVCQVCRRKFLFLFCVQRVLSHIDKPAQHLQ